MSPARRTRHRPALTLAALAVAAGACAEPGHALLRHAVRDLPGQVLRGTLVERDSCLGLASPDTGWTVVMWPFASGATRSRDFVRVGMTGTSVRLGDAIAVRGGFADPGTEADRVVESRRVRDRCPAVRYFLVEEIVEHQPA